MAELEKIIEELEKLNVVQINELVKALEERWGVTASAMAAPMAVSVQPTATETQVEEEKTTVDLILKDAGDSKLQVIKVIRELAGLGLKEAKELADNVPKPIKTGISREEAEQLAEKFSELGAVVELR